MASLDTGQVRAMFAQLHIDDEADRLQMLLANGQISPGDYTAAMQMLMSDAMIP